MTIGYLYMSLPVNHLLPINAGTLKQTCIDRNRLACHETRVNGTREREGGGGGQERSQRLYHVEAHQNIWRIKRYLT